jgi:hypothetical protein
MPSNVLPFVVEAESAGADLAAWCASNRELIADRLIGEGGILFRGFDVGTPESFQRAIETVSPGRPWDYGYAHSPRTRVNKAILTSTDAPPLQTIPSHNEASYAARWPRKIWFMCVTPPTKGGETPIGDSRRVLARLDPDIRKDLQRRGITYVRNFPADGDFSWHKFLLTEDREEAESLCRTAGFAFRWLSNGGLRTARRGLVLLRHPETKEWVWFNQLHIYHSSAIGFLKDADSAPDPADDTLLSNVFYGDGSPIDAAVVHHVRAAYDAEAIYFKWQEGDVLLLDNILATHGRHRYLGTRRILAGMAEPMSEADLDESGDGGDSLPSP